jgi:hypothetical protein
LKARPDVAIVYGPTRWWHPENCQADWVDAMDREAGRIHQPPSLLIRVILLQMGDVPCTCAVLIRKVAIEVVGGFEERFRLYEDQTLWVKLLSTFPAYVTDYCGARYRQHDASTSSRAIADGSYDRVGAHPARASFLKWVQEYAGEAGMRNWRLNLAIRLARAPYTARRGVGAYFYRVVRRGLLVAEIFQGQFGVRPNSPRLDA